MHTESETVLSFFADQSPVDLLDWLVYGDREEQNLAATELFNRYKAPLFRAIKRSVEKEHGTIIAEEIVYRTFAKAIKGAAGFKRVEAEDLNAMEKRFFCWLRAIAKNIFCSWYRRNKQFCSGDEDFWKMVDSDISRRNESPPNEEVVEIVRDLIQQLPQRDQDILRAYMNHCPDVTNPQSKLPSFVISELCETYGTTRAYIRTIKRRALKQLKDGLEANGISYE